MGTPTNEHNTTQAPFDFERMQKLLEDQAKEIAILKSLQDPTSLAAASAQMGSDKRPRFALRTVDGRVAVKWDNMITNTVRMMNGQQHADQTTRIYFEDGTDEVVSMDNLQPRLGRTEYYPADAIEITAEGRFLTLDRPEGKVKVHETFVNP